MATIKFSEFDAGNINAGGAQIVGLEGGNNKIFNAADLVNGLATVTYVDAQDTILQNQITQNANDIAAIDLDTGNIEANIATLQGQVTVIEGNIVVLEGAVAALENNVSVNADDITVIRGNITLIEQQIADLEANGNIQTLSLDNSSNVLSISGGNSVDFTPVLANVSGTGSAWTDVGNSVVYSSDVGSGVFIQDERSATIFHQSQLFFTNSNANEGGWISATSEILNLGHVTNIDPAVDNSGTKQPYMNVFKTGQVAVQNSFNTPPTSERFYVDGNAKVTGYIQATDFLDANGNSIIGGGGGGNPFDQDLNTTDDVTFNAVTVNGNMDVNGAGTHAFQGTIEFSQLTNFGGTVGITDILDEDDMNSDSATALATQQSIKAYVDANSGGGGGNYSNANVTAYAETGWAGNIIPSANVTYDLGSPTNAWKDLYLSNSTIYLGGQTISVDNDGTIAFSGNISAPAMVDDTLLIINDGTLTTSQAGSTDGLEWEAVVIPNSADGEIIKEVVGNDSGILAFTRYAEITYSLDNGVTWNMLHIIDDLGYSAFGRYDFTVAYYSPGLDLFYILGDDGYYFTTSDFQTFSGQQQANVNWGTLGYEVPTITESDTRILFVEPSSRKGYYADISNPSVWTQVANLGLPVQSDCDVHYTGSAFVIISLGDQTCRVSTDNGVTWSSGGDLRGGISGNYFSKDSSVDPDTGTLVVGMNFNSLTISTDNGLNWTLTDMSSIFTAYPSNAQLRNVSYGAGLWCINASSSSMGSPWWDTQYVSEDITDLNTWKIVSTPLPGPYSIEGQTYINGNFWGPAYDLLFKLEWPVGTQVLLFNDEVVATRNDIAYVVSAQAQAQAEKVSTKELEILSKTFDGNANVSQSSTLTYSANSLVISDAVTMGGPFRLVNMTTTERDALSAANGDMIYNTTLNKLQGYQNGSWINLDGT